MDSKDGHTPSENSHKELQSAKNRFHGQRYADYIEEQLHEAEERGVFRDLPGQGQPLKLDSEAGLFAGDKALGYSLLKNNGHLPAELELGREIDRELERLAGLRISLLKHGRKLRQRAVPPFPSEKRAYNAALKKGLETYEAGLREVNRKILTLNISTPSLMHRIPLEIERMIGEFRSECQPFR